jgi:Ca2+-binding EF-hand superfamily protein
MMKFLLGAAAAAIAASSYALGQPAAPPPGVAQGTAPVAAVPLMPRVHTFHMQMPPESRDEVVAHVREMFASLDSNKDGFVTREEANAAHKAMIGEMRTKFDKRLASGDFPHRDRGAMFDRLDTNKDGMISRQEYMSAKPDIREQHVFVMRDGGGLQEVRTGHAPGTPEGPTRVTILQDGSGPVEVSSRPGEPGVKVMRMHRMAMHGRMFDDADANHDGRVSLDEMTAMALQHFDSADANHDGKLSPDERMQMHPRIMTERVRVQPS